MAQVAKDFDLTPSSVRRWAAQAAVDAGERPGLTTEERQELAQLRRENKRLREDVEILRRATTFMWTARLCRLPRDRPRPPCTWLCAVTNGSA